MCASVFFIVFVYKIVDKMCIIYHFKPYSHLLNGSFKNICDFLEVDEDEFIENVLNFTSIRQDVISKYKNLYKSIRESATIYNRLLEICQSDIEEELTYYLLNVEDWVYLSLGKERIKALGYNSTKINKELENTTVDKDILKQAIYEEFKTGDRITKSVIKERLSNLYNRLNLNKTAKAIDLEEWFEVKRIKVGGRNGFKLVKQIM